MNQDTPSYLADYKVGHVSISQQKLIHLIQFYIMTPAWSDISQDGQVPLRLVKTRAENQTRAKV